MMQSTRLKALALAGVLSIGSAAAWAQSPTPYGAPLNLEQARKVLAGAEAEALRNNWNMVVAIVDAGGHLMLLQRMDNTAYGSVEVAREKAQGAVAFRRPTKAFQELIAQGGAHVRLLNLTGDAAVLEGGIPIVVDGKMIGAVGVSGGSSPQDHQVAQAGVDALK